MYRNHMWLLPRLRSLRILLSVHNPSYAWSHIFLSFPLTTRWKHKYMRRNWSMSCQIQNKGVLPGHRNFWSETASVVVSFWVLGTYFSQVFWKWYRLRSLKELGRFLGVDYSWSCFTRREKKRNKDGSHRTFTSVARKMFETQSLTADISIGLTCTRDWLQRLIFGGSRMLSRTFQGTDSQANI